MRTVDTEELEAEEDEELEDGGGAEKFKKSVRRRGPAPRQGPVQALECDSAD